MAKINDFWDFLEDTALKENNIVETENGALAYASTLNKCLDAFGSLGAMRFSHEEDIVNMYENAFNENRELALKMLFYFRDIRGGQGQRRVFRTILKWLANNYSNDVISNLDNIIYYGRGDDYICLLDTKVSKKVCDYLKEKISTDWLDMRRGRNVSLLAKWLPSINTSSEETRKYANKLIRAWGWEPKVYRKILSSLRSYIDVTEVKMSSNEWDKINYSAVPAKASMVYSNAFIKHDEDNYLTYIKSLSEGNAKVNAKSLFPVDIIHKVYDKMYNISKKDRILLDAMWNSLPNYLEGKDETGICVVDTSGSMIGLPLEVALSLGIYCADKCHGPFKNRFITFSRIPQLIKLNDGDIVDKVKNIKPIIENTDIEAVFNLILKTAINSNCKQEDLPSKIYIISDMQFDSAQGYYSWYGRKPARKPFMQIMRERYEKAGYKMPALIYWNVRASKCGMFHDTFDGENIAMVSGYSPSLFKSIIEGTTYEEVVDSNGKVTVKEKIDPITVMLNTLNNERYSRVVIS